MANYPYPYNQFNGQPGATPVPMSQIFQPSNGNFYLINSAGELSNVPISNGISAALCFNEGVLYLKALQNGSPTVVPYKIIPYNDSPKEEVDRFAKIEERLEQLENSLKSKKGGGLDGLI